MKINQIYQTLSLFLEKTGFQCQSLTRQKVNHKIVQEEFSRNPYIEINFIRLFGDYNVKGKSILIIGANRGYEAELFLTRGAKAVVGVDVFLPKEIYKSQKFKFVQAPAEMLPFKDSSFDIVYSQAVLEHVADLEKTFTEIIRVLRRGGMSLHIASPLWFSRDGHHLPHLLSRWPWCHVGRNAEELIRWIENQGFAEGMQKDWRPSLSEAMDKISINQYPSINYLKAVNSLRGVEVLENSFDLDTSAKKDLNSEILGRLPINLAMEELERFSFVSVIKKI